jgi:hypothetical protein
LKNFEIIETTYPEEEDMNQNNQTLRDIMISDNEEYF